MQYLANGSLGQRHPENLGDFARQIGSPPTDDAIFRDIRPFADPIGQFLLLFRAQGLRPTRRLAGAQAGNTIRVIPDNPIPQRLAVHPRRCRRFAARLAFQNQSQRQQPPRDVRIIRPRRSKAKRRSIKISTGELYRC